MTKRKWQPLTPTQEFHKAYREYDAWVKKEMLKHADEIEAMLEEMEAASEQAKSARH